MGELKEIRVPDIGDFKDVPIIEIAVQPGQRVGVDAPLITLESDKAAMEVPSRAGGVVKSPGRLTEGTRMHVSEVAGVGGPKNRVNPAVSAPPAPTSAPAGVADVRVPDIGDFKDVPIIEVMVKSGDSITAEQPLVTL